MKILAIRGCNLASLAGELAIDLTPAIRRCDRREHSRWHVHGARCGGAGMKILAIHGCNLASLAGELAIDPTPAPFADAIVGNTRAGTSTERDAEVPA